MTAAWVPAITSTKLKHGVRDSERLRCHRAEWKQEATLEQQGEESVLQQRKKMLQRDGNNHACRAKCHGLSWQENPRLGKEWTLKQVGMGMESPPQRVSWIHFSNGWSCLWAKVQMSCPHKGPSRTFSPQLSRQSTTLTLFGLIQSVEMTWYLFPALPIAQLHAHTHLSCTLAPLVSFPWTLPSFTVM